MLFKKNRAKYRKSLIFTNYIILVIEKSLVIYNIPPELFYSRHPEHT